MHVSFDNFLVINYCFGLMLCVLVCVCACSLSYDLRVRGQKNERADC